MAISELEAVADDREPASASPEQALPALFARLKAEARHGHGKVAAEPSDRSIVRSRLRSLAERSWTVRFARPLERRPGLRGAILYPIKRCLARLIGWYVEPFAADQRGFNDALLKLVDELFEEIDALFETLRGLEAELGQRRGDALVVQRLEERVLRLERERLHAGRSRTLAKQPR